MASGSSKAHSKLRRIGKSNSVTAAADTVPMLITPALTNKHSKSEVPT